jgi:nitroreductase/dihydropteridine reductase
MDFFELAKYRYTTKKYAASGKIAEDKIEQLKEILRLSPSSINSQPWKFYFIDEQKLKSKLAEVSYYNEPKILNSSHIVVFCAVDDVAIFENNLSNYVPETAVNYYKTYLQPLGESAIKSWMQHQVYLSLGFFLSACAAMEIDSTPMEGIQKNEYDRILNLNGYKTLFAVAIGFRDEADANQPQLKPKSRLALENVIVSIS